MGAYAEEWLANSGKLLIIVKVFLQLVVILADISEGFWVDRGC
jgi:hypothetical protein